MTKKIKLNEGKSLLFCGGFEKSHFEQLHKEFFKIFLEVLYEEELIIFVL